MPQITAPKDEGVYQALLKDLAALDVPKPSGLMIPVYLLLSPGFLTIFLYRVSAHMFRTNVIGRVISRILWRLNVMLTGCHLDPRAKIGAGCAMPHPTGIVISKSAIIGKNALIYQNVTIGTKHSTDGQNKTSPVLMDNVHVFSGAVIVGSITVGEDSKIGANAVVMADVPSQHLAVGVPAKCIAIENKTGTQGSGITGS